MIRHTLLGLALLQALMGSAQLVSNKPLPPMLDGITVNPGDGSTTLQWTPPGPNPLNPVPIGYIIYRRTVDHLGNTFMQPIDTVGPDVFTFTDALANANAYSQSYTVASHGPTEPSSQSAEHHTIFLTLQYDSCGHKIDLSWQHYRGWGNRIARYNIYMGTNTSWQAFERIQSVDGWQHIAYVSVPPHSTFFFYVEAVLEGDALTSRSNMTFISTQVARWPGFMNVDSVMAYDDRREIRFTIDPASQLSHYQLVRWETPDSVLASFTAKTLHTFSNPSERAFTDTTDAWTARSRRFYYRLHAFDGCNRLVKTSNLPNSMVIRLIPRSMSITVEWDRLHSPHWGVARYQLYRTAFRDGIPFTERIHQVVSEADRHSHTDNLSGFEGQGYSAQFCYHLLAVYGEHGQHPRAHSRSRTACMQATPNIALPNAIDPLSPHTGFLPRNLFAPIISFDASYTLTIYNRWGEIVFAGRDQGWNGRLANGQLAKEGAYVYRLEVYLPNQRSIVRTGSLTVMYAQ